MGGGGKGFSGLALALIEKHFNGWNNAPAYVLNLTDGQSWALLTWLWVQHLLSEERTAADFETDRGLDTYAYREWQQQKADIEESYGAFFAGVNNRIGLICKRVEEICPARLLPIDERDLRAEVAHYGEEAT